MLIFRHFRFGRGDVGNYPDCEDIIFQVLKLGRGRARPCPAYKIVSLVCKYVKYGCVNLTLGILYMAKRGPDQYQPVKFIISELYIPPRGV